MFSLNFSSKICPGLNAAAVDCVESSTTKTNMEKFITLIAVTVLSLSGFAPTAFAHEEDEEVQARTEQQRIQEQVYEQRGVQPGDDRQVYEQRGIRPGDDHRVFEHRQDGGGQLQRQIDHLNRMVDHVRGEMRAYGAGRHIRSEYEHLRAETYQLNSQFRRGDQYYDRRRVRAEIEHMHGELHHIEEELHVPTQRYYQWR